MKGEEVIVEHIDQDRCIAPKPRANALLACPNHRVLVGKAIDLSMLLYGPTHLWGKPGANGAFHKVAH